MKGIFVTGTDTNVGKTVASAALMIGLRETYEVCYWKPVQTGIEIDDDTATVRALANCTSDEIYDKGFRLERPVSPHLAAEDVGLRLNVDATIRYLDHAPREKFFIVEGAGGVLVPLNRRELILDLIEALSLPVVVVARSGIGTINHTLMTLETLRSQWINVLGVILNGEPNASNRDAIEHFGKTRVLAEIPRLEGDLPKALQRWADITPISDLTYQAPIISFNEPRGTRF